MIAKILWRLKSQAASFAGHAGGYAVARALTRDSPRILMYHRFAAESSPHALGVRDFDYQVREIARLFRPTTMRGLARELRSPHGARPGSIAITVDDGYADFHEYALPVLKRHGVPATLFATTGFIDRKLWLWPDVIEYALAQATKPMFSLPLPTGGAIEFSRATPAERGTAHKRLVALSLTLPDEQMRALHQALLQELAVVLPEAPTKDYAPLSWQQLRELAAAGIEIGAHTQTHPCLSKIGSERLHEEIAGSRRRLEEMLGAEVLSFCYPNGTPDDLNEEVKRVVREAGFLSAPVAYFDARVTDDIYELRRYPVGSWRRNFLQAVHGIELLSARRSLAAANQRTAG